MKAFFSRKTIIQVAALVFGGFLWFSISLNKNYELQKKITLVIDSLPEGYILTDPLPPWIPVIFYGSGKELLTLQLSRSIHYRIDVTKLSPYTPHQIRFSSSNVSGLDGFTTVDVKFPETESLLLQWSKRVKKRVPIRLNNQNRKQLSERDTVRITPAECEISGADIFLKKITAIETLPITFQHDEVFEEKVGLVLRADYKNITLDPHSVQVQIKRYAGRLIRWDKVPIRVSFVRNYKPRHGEILIPEHTYCSVQLEIPPNYDDTLQVDDLQAEILIDSPINDQKSFPIRLNLKKHQSHVRIHKIEPESIRVKRGG